MDAISCLIHNEDCLHISKPDIRTVGIPLSIELTGDSTVERISQPSHVGSAWEIRNSTFPGETNSAEIRR